MTVDENKAVCKLHVEFVKQEMDVFAQYQEKILDTMTKNGQGAEASRLQQQYQTMVNENMLSAAVKKYSSLLKAFDQYKVKEMDWSKDKGYKPKKKLKKSKEKMAQRRAARQRTKDKEKNQEKDKEKNQEKDKENNK